MSYETAILWLSVLHIVGVYPLMRDGGSRRLDLILCIRLSLSELEASRVRTEDFVRAVIQANCCNRCLDST